MLKTFSTRAAFVVGILAFALWLTTHPYHGMIHDEQFYAVMALDRLHQGLYGSDLFFLYGSQNSFTVFTPFLAWWIKSYGLDNGLLWATVVGQALWIGALITLVAALFPPRQRAWCLLTVALFPAHYSQVFSFGEAFATPRLYSEALAMLGLSALLRSRYGAAATSLLMSMLVHPLMALPAMGLALIYKIPRPRIWFATLIAIVAAAIVLAILGWGPFASMGQVLPADLVAFERLRSPWLFLDQWRWKNVSSTIAIFVILMLAMRLLDPPLPKLAMVTFIIAALGLGLSLLAALSNYALLLALQANRALWVAQLLAAIFCFPVVMRLWQDGTTGKYPAILLVCAVIGPSAAFAPIAILALAYEWGGRKLVALSSPSPFIRWLIWLFPLQVILWTLLSAWTTYLSHDTFDSQPIFLRLFGDLLPMGLAISWLISANYRRSRELLQGALLALTCVAICLTVRQWYVSDNRILLNTPVRQRVIAPLQRAIPEGAVVYWEEGLHEAWFWLGRANYVSFGQLAGSVFTPRTAVEGRRRMRLLDAAGFSDNSWDFNEQIQLDRSNKVHDLASIAQLCADPVLHTIILKNPVPQLPAAYHLTDPNTGWSYYSYACADPRISHGPNT